MLYGCIYLRVGEDDCRQIGRCIGLYVPNLQQVFGGMTYLIEQLQELKWDGTKVKNIKTRLVDLSCNGLDVYVCISILHIFTSAK